MKSMLESKTFWGMIVMALGFLLRATGLGDVMDEAAAAELLSEVSTWVMEVIGASVVYWGRLKADVQIKGFLPGKE